MLQDRFWHLLAKKLAGEASEEEVGELEKLIKANPELSYSAQNLTDLWQLKVPENKKTSADAFQKLYASIEAQAETEVASVALPTENKANKKRALPFIIVAFAGLFTLAFFALGKNESNSSAENNQTQEIITRPGTRTKVVLPDSSVVWLNAGSKLTYSQPFGVTNRTVELTGEAYFDVVKNKKLFIIHTNGAQIKVLGTSFNVRSYPSEQKIETSLIRGRVEVMLDEDPDNKYVLRPDEKLTLSTAKNETRKTGLKEQPPTAIRSSLHYIDEQTIAETSWIENKLVFDNESFEEVAKRMERWYGVAIQFETPQLKAEHFTGVFEKETVVQALKAIQLTTPFHFSIKSNEIIITR